jgi:hypothetical protein
VSGGKLPNFEVISQDDHGGSVRCSYCARGMKHVVVLALEDRGCVGEERRLCAYCVLEMARALQRAEEAG